MDLNTQFNVIKVKCEEIKPLVVIRCITYNHEKYIKDALEGFVMQQTKFPFVVIVHDDASLDNTATIIREYAEKYSNIILPIYEEENQYSKPGKPIRKIVNQACYITGAKYIAFCEGDDYWTDCNKLQKQVDALEAAKEFGLCYTKVRTYSFGNKLLSWTGKETLTFEDFIIHNNGIPTCTAVIKTEIYKSYDMIFENIQHNWKMGDLPLWLYISLHYKIIFLPIYTGVYRILQESASHSESDLKWLRFQLNAREIKCFFIENFKPLPEHVLDRMDWKLYLSILRRIINTNNSDLIEANRNLSLSFRTYSRIKKSLLNHITRHSLSLKTLKRLYIIKDRFRVK